MALLDIFKKKKEKAAPAKREKPKKEARPEKPGEVKESPKEPVSERKPRKKEAGESWRILKSIHVTEKATDLAKTNQYVFKVFPGSGKTEIGKAVEDLYGVDVVSVRVVNILPKKRRMGRVEGWRKGYKKAIVRIKEGQKIEVLPR